MSAHTFSSRVEGVIRRMLLDAFKEVGADREAILRLIGREKEFRDYVVSGIRRFSSRVPGYEFAHSTLEEDFISPEEVMLARNIVYTHEQFSMFDDTALNPKAVEWCRENGYILVPGPNRPMSLLEIRALNPEPFSERFFYKKDWSPEVAPFAHTEKVGTRWLALRKQPVPGSAFRGWEDQLSFVGATEMVPNIAEVAWCITTYKAVRGIRLYPNMFVRTSSRDAQGSRVCLGNDTLNNGGSLSVYPWSDSHRSEHVVLTTKRSNW